MNACRLCVGMREVAIVPARAAIQRTTLSGVHSKRAVMISCITNVYAHPARIHDVPSQVKSTVCALAASKALLHALSNKFKISNLIGCDQARTTRGYQTLFPRPRGLKCVASESMYVEPECKEANLY